MWLWRQVVELGAQNLDSLSKKKKKKKSYCVYVILPKWEIGISEFPTCHDGNIVTGVLKTRMWRQSQLQILPLETEKTESTIISIRTFETSELASNW